MRDITAEGLRLIMWFEGFSAVPYRDAGGLLTIGYGHLIREGETFHHISEADAQDLLRNDVQQAIRTVLRLTHVPLSDGQLDALISFTFNLGAGAYQRSSLRRKVNREEHGAVPQEFAKWIYVNGLKYNGLIRRRQAEAMRYQS